MSYPVIFAEFLADGAPESVASMLDRGRALGLRGLGRIAAAFASAEERQESDAWIFREEIRIRITYAEILGEIAAAKAAGDKGAVSELRKTFRLLRRGEGDSVAGIFSGSSLERALLLREGRPEHTRPIYPKTKTDKMEKAKCAALKPKQLKLPL